MQPLPQILEKAIPFEGDQANGLCRPPDQDRFATSERQPFLAVDRHSNFFFAHESDVDLSLEPQAIVISDKPAGVEGAETGKAVEVRPAWSRRLELPFRVDADKANAKFANGILRIELPRAEKTGVRRIAIEG